MLLCQAALLTLEIYGINLQLHYVKIVSNLSWELITITLKLRPNYS